MMKMITIGVNDGEEKNSAQRANHGDNLDEHEPLRRDIVTMG